jgi:hypothetical protein
MGAPVVDLAWMDGFDVESLAGFGKAEEQTTAKSNGNI